MIFYLFAKIIKTMNLERWLLNFFYLCLKLVGSWQKNIAITKSHCFFRSFVKYKKVYCLLTFKIRLWKSYSSYYWHLCRWLLSLRCRWKKTLFIRLTVMWCWIKTTITTTITFRCPPLLRWYQSFIVAEGLFPWSKPHSFAFSHYT